MNTRSNQPVRLMAVANAEPIFRTEGGGDAWRFVSGDPQFTLAAEGGGAASWSAGWHLFTLDIKATAGSVAAPCLYPDYGEGYSEATRIDLPVPDADGRIELLLVFPASVHRLRFDPSIATAEVTIGGLSLAPLSRLSAFRRMFAAVISEDRGKGGVRGMLRTVRSLASAFRARRARGVGDYLLTRYRRQLEQVSMSYQDWIVARGTAPAGDKAGVLVSVIMPTCNTPAPFLRAAIDSVVAQSYANWELCIADDASDVREVKAILDEYAARYPAVKVVKRAERGGISRASNDALALASGEFVAFLDHDDTLSPNALGALVARARTTGADVVYSDHDYLSESGERCDPYFKPDWSPDLFSTQMYLAHLVMIRRSIVMAAGGLDPACDGAQDYDLVLRCIRQGARFEHVPEILYHWRRHAGSTAANPGSKPYAHLAGQRALQNHVDVVAPGARVEEGPWLFCYDVRYPLPAPPPRVSIIIPTKDRLDLLEPCIDSILSHTDHADYEILIVDNGSREQRTMDWLADAANRHANIRVLDMPVPFNWSLLNNRAAAHATGQVLVFLNNDTEVLTRDWLQRLSEHVLRPEVGTCGPLLLYPDDTIQHAGVVVGMGGWADHVFKGQAPQHSQHLFVSPMMRRNVLAVTGACVAISAARFSDLGGFDESFLVCGSDVELCLRAHRQGLLNVYLPEARLYHHESKTRDARDVPANDFERSAEAYGEFRLSGDPFYNRNLDVSKVVPTLGGLL